MEELINRLKSAKEELDHNKVAWIDKYLIIDLNQKASILISSLESLTNRSDNEAVITSSEEFLNEVALVIKKINGDE